MFIWVKLFNCQLLHFRESKCNVFVPSCIKLLLNVAPFHDPTWVKTVGCFFLHICILFIHLLCTYYSDYYYYYQTCWKENTSQDVNTESDTSIWQSCVIQEVHLGVTMWAVNTRAASISFHFILNEIFNKARISNESHIFVGCIAKTTKWDFLKESLWICK